MDLEQISQRMDLLWLVRKFQLHVLPLFCHFLLESTEHDWNFGLKGFNCLGRDGGFLLRRLKKRLELGYLGGEVEVLVGQKLVLILSPLPLLLYHTQLSLCLLQFFFQLLEIHRILLQILVLNDLVAFLFDQGVEYFLTPFLTQDFVIGTRVFHGGFEGGDNLLQWCHLVRQNLNLSQLLARCLLLWLFLFLPFKQSILQKQTLWNYGLLLSEYHSRLLWLHILNWRRLLVDHVQRREYLLQRQWPKSLRERISLHREHLESLTRLQRHDTIDPHDLIFTDV